MTPEPLPRIDADLPGLLRRLHAEPATAAAQTLAAIGPARAAAPATLVGALCLGGPALAARLLGEDAGDDAMARVVDAFCQLVEPPAGALPDHERRVAAWLIEGFGLQADAASLLDLVRAEFLIACAPLAELPEALLGAMRHRQWALALRGVERLRDGLAGQTPRHVFGLAAMCLHHLGRFDEADAWVREGLGAQQALLAIGPVHTEAALLQRWGANAEPVVSIVCPTYNHERYIESTIRGFLSQDCDFPFEILIHDDASTDGTQAVIRRWQAQYPTIIRTVLQTENQFSRGIRPFELLLAQARGAYVATCEGDDFWIDAAKLQRQVAFLQANPAYSCSAHNYLHLHETHLTVRPWTTVGRDFVLTERQLMNVQAVLWLPTLVFRKTFTRLPPERDDAAIGDQFLTSWLGTQGRCMYFETMHAAVRRENEFSTWSPLSAQEKERRRIKTWAALARLHARLGQRQAVADLMARIQASTLDAAVKHALLDEQALAAA